MYAESERLSVQSCIQNLRWKKKVQPLLVANSHSEALSIFEHYVWKYKQCFCVGFFIPLDFRLSFILPVKNVQEKITIKFRKAVASIKASVYCI